MLRGREELCRVLQAAITPRLLIVRLLWGGHAGSVRPSDSWKWTTRDVFLWDGPIKSPLFADVTYTARNLVANFGRITVRPTARHARTAQSIDPVHSVQVCCPLFLSRYAHATFLYIAPYNAVTRHDVRPPQISLVPKRFSELSWFLMQRLLFIILLCVVTKFGYLYNCSKLEWS